MQETSVRSLGREDPLEKEMAPHSSTLAWRIPWREEPGRLQSMGWQRVRHDWATSLSLFTPFKSCKGNSKSHIVVYSWITTFFLAFPSYLQNSAFVFTVVKNATIGTPRAAQWWRLCALKAGGTGLVPDRELRSHMEKECLLWPKVIYLSLCPCLDYVHCSNSSIQNSAVNGCRLLIHILILQNCPWDRLKQMSP